MKKIGIGILVAFVALAFVVVPAFGQQQPYTTNGKYDVKGHTPTGDMMLYDLVLVRPAGVVACVVGLVGSVLALPFAAMSHSQDKVEQRLIKEPFHYTFTRPLGEFGD